MADSFDRAIERAELSWNVDWADSLSANSTLVRVDQRGWMEFSTEKGVPTIAAEWYAECAIQGSRLFLSAVTSDPEIRGGRPVLVSTGFTVAETLSELADSSGVTEVADNFSLDAQVIRDLLDGLSLMFERPFKR